MQVGVKDKRIKAAVQSAFGDNVTGLQVNEADRIRIRFTVLIASNNLKEVAGDHPEWRIHRWKGKVQWSIDVLANTRLLFDYDAKAHSISNMIYDDPH